MNLAFVLPEELWRSWSVLSVSAYNTLLDLHNSSDYAQPHPIIAKYAVIYGMGIIWYLV